MTINYKFECVDLSDFKATFSMKAKSKLFHKIFLAAIKKLEKKGKIKNKKYDTKTIEKFDITPQFYNFILVNLKSKIKQLIKIVRKDGIHVLNYKCSKAWFQRDSKNDWDIYIIIGGQYVRK